MDQQCRETGAMPLYALQSVNFSVLDRGQYMEALYADITHTKDWDVAASSMRRMHPALASLLKLVTLNTYNPEKKRGRTEEAILAAVQKREKTRGVAYEGILLQLQRLRSQHNAPLLDRSEINGGIQTRAEQRLLEGRKRAEATHVVLLDARLGHRDD